jgi:hypothetical protein
VGGTTLLSMRSTSSNVELLSKFFKRRNGLAWLLNGVEIAAKDSGAFGILYVAQRQAL